MSERKKNDRGGDALPDTRGGGPTLLLKRLRMAEEALANARRDLADGYSIDPASIQQLEEVVESYKRMLGRK
jgi:hypothetical protein